MNPFMTDITTISANIPIVIPIIEMYEIKVMKDLLILKLKKRKAIKKASLTFM